MVNNSFVKVSLLRTDLLDLLILDCILRENEVNEDECLTILHQYMTTNGYTLPVMIGEDLDQDTRKKLILFLVSIRLLLGKKNLN